MSLVVNLAVRLGRSLGGGLVTSENYFERETG